MIELFKPNALLTFSKTRQEINAKEFITKDSLRGEYLTAQRLTPSFVDGLVDVQRKALLALMQSGEKGPIKLSRLLALVNERWGMKENEEEVY